MSSLPQLSQKVTQWVERVQLAIHYRHRRQQFDRLFAHGDAFDTRGEYEQWKYTQCLHMLEVPPRRFHRVLEIGCAEGAFTERLAPHSEQIIAVDIATPAVTRARQALRNFQHVQVHCGNVTGMSFEEPFDLIVASDVIYYMGQEHSEDHLDGILARFAEWIAPGGRILVANGYKLDVPQEDWFHRDRMLRYRVKLERCGLVLTREHDVRGDTVGSHSTCVVSVLEKPGDRRGGRV